jgi:hypothetical protein
VPPIDPVIFDRDVPTLDVTQFTEAPGLVLVHNQLSSSTPAHEKTFGAWWAKPAAEIMPCNCGWRPDLGDHYRVHRPGPIVRSETCSLNRLADSRFGPSKA